MHCMQRIMSAKYCLPVPVFHFWPKLTHPAIAELLVTHRSTNFPVCRSTLYTLLRVPTCFIKETMIMMVAKVCAHLRT